MADNPSDDEILARAHQYSRRSGRLQWAGIFFLGLVLATQFAVIQSSDLLNRLFVPTMIFFGFCIAAFLFYRLAFVGRRPEAARAEHLIPRQIDDYQSTARRTWLILVIVLLSNTFMQSYYTGKVEASVQAHRLPADYLLTHPRSFSVAFEGLYFLVIAICFAMPWTFFRRAENRTVQDELSRELRAKTLKLGYVLAIFALVVAYAAVSLTRIDPVQILLWLTFAAVAIPMLHFLVVEWRADRNDD